MRIRTGRPDIGRYRNRFDVPPAGPGLSVTFLGVSTLLVGDGTSAIMTDGFFSRPSLWSVALRRIAPRPARIDAALARAGVASLDAVVPVHTHFDHAMDSAAVAARTGARLLGGPSAVHVGRGGGLGEDAIVAVTPGRPVVCGAFTLTFVESEHCPPDRFPGTIGAPARASPCTSPPCGGARIPGPAWTESPVSRSHRPNGTVRPFPPAGAP